MKQEYIAAESVGSGLRKRVAVVLQCSGSKHPDAAMFVDGLGRRVKFVSNPSFANNPDRLTSLGYRFAHPDETYQYLANDLKAVKAAETDDSPRQAPPDWESYLPQQAVRPTWRDAVMAYNLYMRHETLERGRKPAEVNYMRLLPAVKMYDRKEFGLVLKAIGKVNTFICSAGWGIIRSDFLTPAYDVTFMSGVPSLIKRGKSQQGWKDWNQLPGGANEWPPSTSPVEVPDQQPVDEVHFFVSASYLPMVQGLCRHLPRRKVIHYAADLEANRVAFDDRNFEYVRHASSTCWNYPAAAAFAQSL